VVGIRKTAGGFDPNPTEMQTLHSCVDIIDECFGPMKAKITDIWALRASLQRCCLLAESERDQRGFTSSEVATDWHELMVWYRGARLHCLERFGARQ